MKRKREINETGDQGIGAGKIFSKRKEGILGVCIIIYIGFDLLEFFYRTQNLVFTVKAHEQLQEIRPGNGGESKNK